MQAAWTPRATNGVMCLVVGLLTVALPGCGGDSQPTGADGQVEIVPPTNLPPGESTDETGFK